VNKVPRPSPCAMRDVYNDAVPRRSALALGFVRTHLAVLALVPVLSACVVPYHYTIRPGVSGRVVDRRSLEPISSAKVTVVSRSVVPRQAPLTLSVTVNSDGRFALPAERRWGLYIAPMDIWGPMSETTVSAVDYETESMRLSTNALGPKAVELGTVFLDRQP
jgi:hypothetical protein